jgi:Cu2+-containing amine oxidase
MIARLLAIAALFIAGAAQAQPRPIPIAILARIQLLCPNVIVQDFPSSGPPRTTWRICWREVAGSDSAHNPNGLVIGPVYFRPSPNAAFIEVMYDMRVSDYFVPYHPGSPRFYDLSGFNFTLTNVSAADCPASVGGAVVSPHVCKEVHDRGLLWKDAAGVRRGEELVLWGAINAANYRYIQEYTFRDDGFILGRVGATGQNLPGAATVPHSHDAYWRLDMDLGGAAPNNVTHATHAENPADPAGVATDTLTPVATGAGFSWSARGHDTLVISNPNLTNAQGHLSEYHLVEMVTGGGITSHYEPFTHDDLWVTHFDPAQFAASKLPSYVGTNVANADVVLWVKATIHHHPRDEDGLNGTGSVNGTADVMWSGFALIPHNLFNCSPFYSTCP